MAMPGNGIRAMRLENRLKMIRQDQESYGSRQKRGKPEDLFSSTQFLYFDYRDGRFSMYQPSIDTLGLRPLYGLLSGSRLP